MECRGYSEAYYQLALAVAEDDDVVGFLSQMSVAQPNLFFASVQLLAGRDHMPSTGAELRQFLRRRGGEVADVMRSRRTQTNEVGRCAVLLPALPPGPLALIEVGASAGLCLLLDQFYYELEPTPLGERLVARSLAVRARGSGSIALGDPGDRLAAGTGSPSGRRARRGCSPVAHGVRVAGSSRASPTTRRGDRIGEGSASRHQGGRLGRGSAGPARRGA